MTHAGAVAWWRIRTLIPARPGKEDAVPGRPVEQAAKPPKPERRPKEQEPEVALPSTLGTLLDRKRGAPPPSDPPPEP